MIATFKNFGFQIGTAYQIYDDCVDLAGSESVTGKTLGTDLRKGKFTLPVLIFLRSASEFERERCCQLVLDEKIEEMIELLKNRREQRRVKRVNRSGQRSDSQSATCIRRCRAESLYRCIVLAR